MAGPRGRAVCVTNYGRSSHVFASGFTLHKYRYVELGKFIGLRTATTAHLDEIGPARHRYRVWTGCAKHQPDVSIGICYQRLGVRNTSTFTQSEVVGEVVSTNYISTRYFEWLTGASSPFEIAYLAHRHLSWYQGRNST